MKSRSNWIALGIMLALGSWYYFYEVKGKATRDQQADDKKLVFYGFDPAAVQEILIQKGSDRISLQKSGNDWALVRPVSAAADATTVSSLLDAIRTMKREDVVDDKGSDAKDFGLLSPAASVSFASGPGSTKTVFFGIDSPTQEYAYAQVQGDPSIFTTMRMNKLNMIKEVKDYRDKTALSFDPAQVSSVASTFGKGLGIATDRKGQWEIVAPAADKGDHDQILSWFQQLSGLRISEFIDEKGSNLAKYGLSAPLARLKIQSNGSTKALILDEGAKAGPNRGRYYKLESKPLVFTLADYATPVLEKKAADLADHKAFGFQPFQVLSFEVSQGTKLYRATKTNGVFAWNPGPPSKAGSPTFDFLGFLSDLSAAEVSGRLPEAAAIAKSSLEITLRGDKDAVLEKITVGDPDAKGLQVHSLNKNQTVEVAKDLFAKLPL